MKNKDQILLENLYITIFENRENESEKNEENEMEDFEIGETNFSHGQGYPNSFLYNDYDDIVHNYIVDIDTEEHDRKIAKISLDFIKKKYSSNTKLMELFKTNNFENMIIDNGFNSWIMQQIYKTMDQNQYDNLHKDLENVFATYNNPSDVESIENYPLFVSLYDVTKIFMGHQEGGYFPKKYDLINSYQAKNPKQAQNIVKFLLNSIKKLDLDGRPIIHFEKEKGSQEKTPTKTWLQNELE
jgi:hypothetical protein